ncbi:protein kinase [Gordonia sp. ABSL1-1]|uniref:serine/threonine-protein kinase n=1 Tax=Gordonia sp. ABSL1-1 TaxID=3053923 RepID=UPI002572C0E9|nr:serine/threonine-protein kinase [Gordonia sp. ABSL1-1]MDL9935289.1 protein kinase [Gordonia sp. ABSL1-1]
MVDNDPQTTQRDAVYDVAGELVAAGFADPTEIGRGGYGAVYRCRQPELDRDVAVKVLTDHLDEENLERFVREQRAMGRLSGHPNIVNVLEVGATPDGFPFIVMQYHPHASLDLRIRKSGPLDWHEVLRLGVKVAGALETAHRAGTLHRDVKPGNILLTDYGEPQLTDFGIARISGGFETDSDLVTGSPAFTAPELLTGSMPSIASDVYGLGATLFCSLTGHAAFERRSGEQVVAHFLRVASEPVPDLSASGYPVEVSRVIESAMAREPEDRPDSALAYGEELREAQRLLGAPVDEMALPLGESTPPVLAASTERRRRITTAPPTPSTKFRPPLRPRAQVARERVLEVLREGERRRLILIHAPTGYGKTTVATQWAEQLIRDGVPVAWLTIDDGDNDLARFLANLVEAIGRADAAAVGDLAEVVDEHGDRANEYVLTSLINEIHARGRRIAVVIDDWHRVSDPAVLVTMDYLLEHGCHHLQMIVTSRSREGLPISRLQVHDEIVEIDMAGLCFDETEADEFLRDVAGLDLPHADVTGLWSSTDGWVAALQLACVSLRGSKRPSELIGHISGRHHAIGDFLAENVVGTLEPDLLSFLLKISVPEQICAGLATALSGEPRAGAMLEEIEARDLFLTRIDQSGDWFRFHSLFGEFLRRRLERDEPQLITPLHRTAAEWFAEHGMLAEAVDHALAAGDADRAVELVETHGQSFIEHSRMAALLPLIDKLPAATVAANPILQLQIAWSSLLVSRPALAEAALDRVRAAIARLPDTEATVRLQLEADVADACVRAISDHIDGLDEVTARITENADILNPFFVSAAYNARTLSAIFRFDFEEAHRYQQLAIPVHRHNAGPYAVMYGYCMDGLAYFEQLDLARAEECFRTGLRLSVERGSSSHSQGARLACALLAEVRYERGDLTESERLLEESFQIGADEGIVDMIKARHLIGSRIALYHNDVDTASRYLVEATEIAERLGLPRLRAFAENEQAIQRLPGRSSAAPGVEADDREPPPVGIGTVVAQLDAETAMLLALGAPDDQADPQAVPHDVLAWAHEWVDRLSGTPRRRALLRAQRHLAVCLSAAGRLDDARDLTVTVLTQCAEVGLIRYPMDGGHVFRRLVRDVRTEARSGARALSAPLSVEFLDRVLGER